MLQRPSLIVRVLSQVAFLSVCVVTAAGAQDPQPGGNQQVQSPAGQESSTVTRPVLPSLDAVRVTGLSLARDHASHKHDERHVYARIGDIVLVDVENLRDLVARSTCMDAALTQRITTGCSPAGIVLFLRGREILGLDAESVILPNGANHGQVQFHLARSADSDEAWADILGRPTLKPPVKGERFVQRAAVSVGLAGGLPLQSASEAVILRLEQFTRAGSWIITVYVLLLIVGVVYVARGTNLLRDPQLSADERPQYSLARVQMAVWFVVVVGAFIFIGLATRNWDSINETALILIGISGATLVASAAIDSEQTITKAVELKAQYEQLKTTIRGLDASVKAGDESLVTTLQASKERLATLKRELELVAPSSKGFIRDILSDYSAQGFHRFQIAVWTAVLAGLFIVSVWDRLAMPVFSVTQLGLMGVSAGTYIGFKFPEAKRTSSEPE